MRLLLPHNRSAEASDGTDLPVPQLTRQRLINYSLITFVFRLCPPTLHLHLFLRAPKQIEPLILNPTSPQSDLLERLCHLGQSTKHIFQLRYILGLATPPHHIEDLAPPRPKRGSIRTNIINKIAVILFTFIAETLHLFRPIPSLWGKTSIFLRPFAPDSIAFPLSIGYTIWICAFLSGPPESK